MKGQDPLFSSASDDWGTPQDFFDALNAEFQFDLDAAASLDNAKLPNFLGPDSPYAADALQADWKQYGTSVWLNPPYSRCAEFVEKAAAMQREGVNTVMLIPARTDTRWFHAFIWDVAYHKPKPDVAIRFIKSRLKFVKPGGETPNGAPFPSMVVIFRGRA